MVRRLIDAEMPGCDGRPARSAATKKKRHGVAICQRFSSFPSEMPHACSVLAENETCNSLLSAAILICCPLHWANLTIPVGEIQDCVQLAVPSTSNNKQTHKHADVAYPSDTITYTPPSGRRDRRSLILSLMAPLVQAWKCSNVNASGCQLVGNIERIHTRHFDVVTVRNR